ncbi:MAG: hypothetical protein UR84_C0013G0004 [candidate division WS6 bacterium GW2011_GWD1_35_594]|nr:MAG: hypothetical protein UR84_C0013G0004 [candidate division WS6 bacterium GW2011_GWD1_35_594]
MESSVKVKNIFSLLIFYILGYMSSLFVSNIEKIDVIGIISSFKQESVIEEIKEPEVKAVCDQQIEQEPVFDPCPIQIDISGAVKSPGVYCFEKDSTVVDAIKKAKGFTPDAGFKYISMKINMATAMIDNAKIYIPFESDYNCTLLNFQLPKEIVEITIPDTAEEGDEVEEECISINEGSKDELDSLDGIGPSTAQKIIDGRPYTKLEDLLNVSGIGEATFNKFKEGICL